MVKGSVAHGKDAAVYVDQYDLTGDLTSLSFPMTVAVAEATSFQDAYEEFIEGLQGHKPSFEALMDDTAGHAWPVLDGEVGSGTKHYLGVYLMGDTAGYAGFEVYDELLDNTPTANLTSAVLHSLTFQGDQEVDHTIVLYNGTMAASAPSTGVTNIAGGASRESDDNVDTDIDLTDGAVADSALGMRFQINHAMTIHRLRLWLKKTGAPAGNLTAAIWSDASGVPSAALATSNTVAADGGLGAAYGWIDFTFATDPRIAGSTPYHLVLDSSGYTYGDGVTEVIWGVDQSSPRTTNYFTTHDGTTWTAYGTNSTAAYEIHALGEKLVGVLRVTAVTGGAPTLDVVIEDAPDNSTWATVITFTQIAAAGVERKEQANEPTDADLRIDATLDGASTFTYIVTAGERDISN